MYDSWLFMLVCPSRHVYGGNLSKLAQNVCSSWIEYVSFTPTGNVYYHRLVISYCLVSSVRRALAFKLRGLWFKSQTGTLGCSAKLKTSFELNPFTDGKKGTFHYIKPTHTISNLYHMHK